MITLQTDAEEKAHELVTVSYSSSFLQGKGKGLHRVLQEAGSPTGVHQPAGNGFRPELESAEFRVLRSTEEATLSAHLGLVTPRINDRSLTSREIGHIDLEESRIILQKPAPACNNIVGVIGSSFGVDHRGTAGEWAGEGDRVLCPSIKRRLRALRMLFDNRQITQPEFDRQLAALIASI